MRSRFALLTLAFFLAAGCGNDGGDDGVDTDASDPSPDAGLDAGTDAPTDAPIDAAPAAPVVTVTSHTDGQRIAGNRTVTLAGTLDADADATVTAVTVTVGAAAPVTATFDQTSFSASVTLSDNANAITVTATDDAARTGSAQLTLSFPYLTLTTFQSASMVMGPSTFTTAAARPADASRLQSPFGRATEIDGILYVSDYAGDRILGFRGFPAKDGASADFVLGQPSTTSALTGVGPKLMDGPQTVLAHGGRMYSLEYSNHRILIWNTPPTRTYAAADAVIGQASLATNATACNASALRNPEDMVVAGSRLVVADAANNRVLIWNTVPTATGVAPDLVLGQSDFTHCQNDDDNQDGIADATPTARTIDYPSGVWSDGTRLFVADADNNRVLVWNTFPTTSFQPADFVLGQPDTTSASAGSAADRFSRPNSVTSNGNQLFVADLSNNRVKIWNQVPSSNVAADLVLGQGDFTHTTRNDDNQDGVADNAPTARTLRSPGSVWLVRDQLFVGDITNNRVLLFGAPVCAVNAGLYEYPAGSGTCIADPCLSVTCTNYRTCARDNGAAVCACPAGFAGDCDTCRVHVDAAAGGSDSGESWTDAMPSLHDALDAVAGTGLTCEVWVKEGTYYAYSTSDADAFSLSGPVTVYGGFAGTESSPAARSGGATILDGRDGAAGTNDVHHVVRAASTTATATLDRVTVRHGNASGTGNDASGGGIYAATSARLVVNGCVVENNRAAATGGGLMYAGGSGASLTISDSTIRNNVAGTSGGGALLAGGTITGSTFDGNSVGTATGHGGGGLTATGIGTISSSTISRNTATGDAGGIWLRGGSSSWTISGVTIAGNRGNNGGGIYFDASGATSTLSSSVVAGNVATGSGGGVFLRDASPTLSNLTIVGNAGTLAAGGVLVDGSSATLTNTIIWDNTAPSYSDIRPGNFAGTFTYGDTTSLFTGTGNISADPLFTHAPVAWDRVTAAPALDTVTVTGGASFAADDYIEIADDGVARQVTGVAGNDLTFTPALAATVANVTVQNWATESANLTADFHLGAGSPCLDTGTPAGTDMGAYP
jgi:hypothetical protein